MALWVCTGCTAAYAVGAVRCPQCGSTEHVEQGAEMAKITVHGGASNAALREPARSAEAEDVEQPAEEPAGTSETAASPVRKRQQRRKT